LLATQLVLRVNERFRMNLPLRRVFDCPTLAAMAREIGRLRVQPGVTPREDSFPPVAEAPRHYPLSSTQRRLWFLEHLAVGGAANHSRHTWRLRGALDARALAAALNHVVRRHEALRTAITVRDGVPVQAVSRALDVPLRTHDLHGEIDAAQPEAVARRIAGDHQRSFDLGEPPLLRANLYCLAQDDHVFALTLHHLVTDGWSTELITAELSHFYANELGCALPALPEPGGQYRDFVLWQQQCLDERFLADELQWWREYVQDAQALEFPADRPRPPELSGRGGHFTGALPPELGSELAARCERSGATPFMVLLAIFEALAYRYTGQQDFVIGTPVAGRSRLVDESAVGFFANTVLLRCRVSASTRLDQLIEDARESVSGALEHQHMPFERLVDALAPVRDLSRNPLFQVMFAVHGKPASPLRLTGLDVEPLHPGSDAAQFDLSFSVIDEPRGLRLDIRYSADLFDQATIAGLAGHFERLLESALRRPDGSVGALEMLGASELARLVHAWNDTSRDFGPARPVHELFECQASRAPQAGAITWGGETLSYEKLNERANRLAHQLIARGAGAGVRVGICLDRTPRMVVALLAILKAGGAYVPLDPGYPAERLAYVLRDSGATLVLSDAAAAHRLCAVDGVTVVDVARAEDAACGELPATNPGLSVSVDQLAYVIYTSGSTGLPKGVMVEHRSVHAFLCWMLDYFSPAERAVVLASTSLSFDVSVPEILGTLVGGGRMVLVDNALALEGLADAGGVTYLSTVPSALRELLLLDAIPDSVRVICSAGEPLSAELADALLRQTSITRLVDAYGPTEDTVYSTAGERLPGGKATVGRPIANSRAYILDADRNLVPVGTPGEMHLAGDGLARGYLNRAELTAERFIEVDIAGRGVERCYRTGDLARYQPDGQLVVLGRIDNQVKVRGHRVEAGEIEAVLERYPGVRQALVTTRPDAVGNAELVGYVETGTTPVSVPEIRQHLAAWLPVHMLPARLHAMQRFPLLPNGKVDRSRLPMAAEGLSEPGGEAPATETERVLAAIWCELLNVATVQRRDDFFALGGQSLLAMSLLGRVERQTGVRIPVASVFRHPTLAELALCIDLYGVAGHEGPIEPVDGLIVDEI